MKRNLYNYNMKVYYEKIYNILMRVLEKKNE